MVNDEINILILDSSRASTWICSPVFDSQDMRYHVNLTKRSVDLLVECPSPSSDVGVVQKCIASADNVEEEDFHDGGKFLPNVSETGESNGISEKETALADENDELNLKNIAESENEAHGKDTDQLTLKEQQLICRVFTEQKNMLDKYERNKEQADKQEQNNSTTSSYIEKDQEEDSVKSGDRGYKRRSVVKMSMNRSRVNNQLLGKVCRVLISPSVDGGYLTYVC